MQTAIEEKWETKEYKDEDIKPAECGTENKMTSDTPTNKEKTKTINRANICEAKRAIISQTVHAMRSQAVCAMRSQAAEESENF